MEWLSALYGRVSTDHSEQQESIKVQKEALMQYADMNGFKVVSNYFDEGFSGTNFDRPEMSRLKKDIEDNKVNLVIVKDLSRIGRNNVLTLLFLDFLDSKNVRLIAINDGYDTLRDEDDLIGIKTWYNERYSKDISKKIRFALKHKKKKGEYLTAFAPYGYRKSSSVKNKLEVDPFAAGVVKEIFRLYISGLGFSRIGSTLDKMSIPNPSSYERYGRTTNRWNWTTIRGIISNPVYTGCSVQQKYRRKTYKSRSICRTPQDEWIWIDDTHDPIIDMEVYNLAQQILKDRKGTRPHRSGLLGPHLFTSFLYCNECGSALYYKKDRGNNGGYRCGAYVKYGLSCCTSHYIAEEELKKIICDELREIIHQNIDCTALEKEILNESVDEDNDLIKKLHIIEAETDRNKQKIEMLYRDRLNSIINEDMFIKLYNEMNYRLQELETQIMYIKDSSVYENQNSMSKREHFVRCILNMDMDIDREMLEWLISRIDICENGDIIINYKFVI